MDVTGNQHTNKPRNARTILTNRRRMGDGVFMSAINLYGHNGRVEAGGVEESEIGTAQRAID